MKKITHEDIISLMAAFRNDNPLRCRARVMSSNPSKLDKTKVLALNEVLIIPFEGKYQIGFCNKNGEYEQIKVENKEMEHLKTLSPSAAAKYIETDKFKNQINKVLSTLESKSKVEANYGNKEGVCQGFTFAWARAIEQGDKAEAHFYERLKTIEKYKAYNDNFQHLIRDIDQARSNIKSLAQKKKNIQDDIKSYQKRQLTEDMTDKTESAYKQTIENLQERLQQYDEEMQLEIKENSDALEIPAFTDVIELAQSPLRHSDLFQKEVTQTDIQNIALMTASLDGPPLDALTKRAPYKSINSIQLQEYFAKLGGIFDRYQEKPPFIILGASFEEGAHAVACQYDKATKQWKYLDINDFQRFPNDPNYYRAGNADDLTKELLKSYKKNGDGSLENFGAEFICPENKLQALNPMIADIDKMEIQINYPKLAPEISAMLPAPTLAWLTQINADEKVKMIEIMGLMDVCLAPKNAANFLQYLEKNPSLLHTANRTLFDIKENHLGEAEEDLLKRLVSLHQLDPKLRAQNDYPKLTPEMLAKISNQTFVWLNQLIADERVLVAEMIELLDLCDISPVNAAKFLEYLEKNPEMLNTAADTLLDIGENHLEDTEEDNIKLLFSIFPNAVIPQDAPPKLETNKPSEVEENNALIKSPEEHALSRSHQIMQEFKKEIHPEPSAEADKTSTHRPGGG